MGLGIVRIRVVESGHDLVTNRNRASVVHIIRKVVEVEKPIHEITAHPQLAEWRCRIARAS